MSVSIFALTGASVRAHMFPQWEDPSVNSSPTAAIVTEVILEEAGELATRLYEENINAGGITDATSSAYLWCTKTLRLMVALRWLRASSQQDPELTKAYAAELAVRWKKLGESGATALGDESLASGTSDPSGPTSHISVNSLETLAGEDMSDALPLLQKKDRL